jgi:hypothetical protein
MILALCPVGISLEDMYDPGPCPVGISLEDIYDPGPLYGRDQPGGHV